MNHIVGLMSSYQHKDMAARDAAQALEHFKDLKAVKSPKTFDRGTKPLAALEGTIPVNYRGKIYNIPIKVWLFEGHPYQPPLVQVQPTATMTIKVSDNVNHDGTVVIPYLREWKGGSSDLSSLIQILTIVFGESPPVFSKRSNTPQNAGSNSTPPYPTYPTSMPQPFQSNTGSGGYPPTSSIPSMGYPYPPSNTVYNPYGSGLSGGGYPPVSGYPTQSMPPYPPMSSGYTPPTSTYPYPQQQPQYGSGSSLGSSSNGPSSQLSADEIKASLLSAVEDKMRRCIGDIISTHKDEMSVLKNTQENLMEGQQKLDEMEKNINTEVMECQNTISILDSKIPVLKEELVKRSQDSECPPEEILQTTAPLYKQLVNSYAEEQAIEDALYILGDGLRRGNVTIEVYLKKVRELSWKQFMLKALIQKCREKASLPDVYA